MYVYVIMHAYLIIFADEYTIAGMDALDDEDDGGGG